MNKKCVEDVRKALSVSEEPDHKGTWVPILIEVSPFFSGTEKIILSIVNGYSKSKDGCYASNAYLAERTGRKELSIRNLINKLVREGWLIKELQLRKLEYGEYKARFLSVNEQMLKDRIRHIYGDIIHGLNTTKDDYEYEDDDIDDMDIVDDNEIDIIYDNIPTKEQIKTSKKQKTETSLEVPLIDLRENKLNKSSAITDAETRRKALNEKLRKDGDKALNKTPAKAAKQEAGMRKAQNRNRLIKDFLNQYNIPEDEEIHEAIRDIMIKDKTTSNISIKAWTTQLELLGKYIETFGLDRATSVVVNHVTHGHRGLIYANELEFATKKQNEVPLAKDNIVTHKAAKNISEITLQEFKEDFLFEEELDMTEEEIRAKARKMFGIELN